MANFSNIEDYIKTINREQRRAKQAADFAKFQHEQELKTREVYTISISRTNKIGLEKFQIHGYERAIKVFNAYRVDGHTLKIKRLRMRAGEDVVHSVLFKY